MRADELLLRHQRLEERVRSLTAEISHLESRLTSDPEVARLEQAAEAARERLQDVNLRLREFDREVEGHRSKMRSRETELMSGRVRNPTELLQMSEEVEHAKARLREEEDRELDLMTEAEEAEAALAAATAALETAREAWQVTLPATERRAGEARAELAAAERERDEGWQEVPAAYRAAYERLQPRLGNPVAEVGGGQCGACRVALTASELQQVRRAEQLLHCQSCGRILVAV